MRPSKLINGRFLYYYTFNPTYRKYAEVNMTGAAGQKRVSSNFLKHTRIFLPAVEEQTRIAQYLDYTCTAIDRAIAVKQQQLKKLDQLRNSIIYKAVTKGLDDSVEMRDSGVDYVGKVPLNWNTCRLKDVVDFFNTVRVPLSAADRGIMTEKVYDYYGASGVIDKVEDYLFDGEYILVAEDGANLLTRNSPLAFIAKGQFWVNNHAHILRPRYGDLNYFEYLLESLEYSIYVTGAAQPKLTKENLGSYKIAVPDSNMQEKIAAYLDIEIPKLNISYGKISEQIKVLQNYKKSLIHECVTGKRRISAADLKQVA